ncbi:MAG: EamA family transporter, partial [Candidatus Heimdallarchaeota archaeon]|nr:EamA family transporter [Candidatus Heimdallarchaeota archaeon]
MEFISLTIIYGLFAALTWGAGDFSGGMAAKSMNPLVVVFQSQLVGISVLTVLVLITSESISVDSIGWSLVAGLFGGIGILFLYHSLAIQKMGIAAPISALVSSAIPIAVSYFVEGALEVVQIMGVGLALFAIILLSVDRSNVAISLEIIKYPIISGVGFGLFFVLIDKSASRSVFLPLVFARLASVIFLFVLINQNDTITGFKLPERRNLGIKVSLAGILDSL